MLQSVDLLALLVQRHDFPDPRHGKRGQIGQRILGRRESHRPGQHVGLDEEPLAVDGLQRLPQPRERLAGIDVGVVLVHHAALELGTLPGQLLRVERDVLRPGGPGGDARKIGNPRRTAQLAAAGPDAADAPRLLPGTDLLHLDADMEPLGEDLDELAEIDALVGDVIEDGLDFVALVLDVADFHVEPHVGSNLTRENHRLVLQGDGLLPPLDVVGLGLAIDFLVLAVVRSEARAAHLPGHHVARERDDAYVVARRSLDRHDVALFEGKVVDVLVERTARILEPDLEDIGRHVVGILLQPIGLVQLETPAARLCLGLVALVAKGAAAADFGLELAGMLFFGIHGTIFCVKLHKKSELCNYAACV